MNGTVDFQDAYYKLFLLKLLGNMEISSSKPMSVFVDGEFDSNQTLFENLSNQNLIGVKAKEEKVGYILLRFLREIIDQRSDDNLFLDIFEMHFEGEYDRQNDLKFSELIDILGTKGDYMNKFTNVDPEQTLLEISGDRIIKTKPINMDLWDLNHIKLAKYGFTPMFYVYNLYSDINRNKGYAEKIAEEQYERITNKLE